jgi:hypothetical protein
MIKSKYKLHTNLFKPQNLKTKKAFQGFLNLNLNQHRCPNCFNILDFKIYFGTCTYFRHKSEDYWMQIISDFKHDDSMVLSLNTKIFDDGKYNLKNNYARMRGKIFNYNHAVVNKKTFNDSAVKIFLLCKKCKYSKQLCSFVKTPCSQSIKKIL